MGARIMSVYIITTSRSPAARRPRETACTPTQSAVTTATPNTMCALHVVTPWIRVNAASCCPLERLTSAKTLVAGSSPGGQQYTVNLDAAARPGRRLSIELRIRDRWGSFYSSDATDPAVRPKLVINCRTGDVFRRADANGDGRVDISDAVSIVGYLFNGGEEPGCLKTADVNDSQVVDISDSIYLLNHLFSGGPPPAQPFPDCGNDPTEDDIGCASYPEDLCS